jgi:hypothetical protein
MMSVLMSRLRPRRDRRLSAEPRQQPVIAPARHQRPGRVGFRVVEFELEAGVIVDPAPERRGKTDAPDVDAARGQKSGAAFQQLERRRQRDRGFARERTQLFHHLVGVAADGEKAFDHLPGFARQRGGGAERGLFQETVGDLAHRAPAHGGDAGDRQQIRHQRMRAFRVRARHRREHALIFRPAVGGGEAQAFQILRERFLAVEILDQPSLPGGREIERRHQRREQPDVAHADFRLADAVVAGRFQPEREHLGVGGRDVRAPK